MHDHAAENVPFDFKGSTFSLAVMQLHTKNIDLIQAELLNRLDKSQQFFIHAPLIIDLSSLASIDQGESIRMPELDFARLVALLREATLMPVGVIHGTDVMNRAAVKAGLGILHAGAQHSHHGEKKKADPPTAAQRTPTMVVTQAVRAGQQIYAQGGDLVIMAAVNAGSEVAADGDIHVYAPLRGKAMAGVHGDRTARIFAQSFAGEMLAIAGHYRVFEDVSSNTQGRVMQAWLEGDKLLLADFFV